MSHHYIQYDAHQQQKTKIFNLMCQNNVDWATVIETCTEMSLSAARGRRLITDQEGRTPLHYACLRHPTLPTIKALIKTHRTALFTKDGNGKLPIHFICDKRRRSWEDENGIGSTAEVEDENVGNDVPVDDSAKILRWLIRLHPESVMHQDHSGDTPLHLCCNHNHIMRGQNQRQQQRLLEFISILIDANPEVMFVKDKLRRTPLHLAVMNKLCPNLIRALMMLETEIDTGMGTETTTVKSTTSTSTSTSQKRQKICLMEDIKGYCPLHYACSYVEVTTECVRLLINACGEALKIRSHNGLTCLELLTMTYREHINGLLKRSEGNDDEGDGGNHDADISYWDKSLLLVYGGDEENVLRRGGVGGKKDLSAYDSTCTYTYTHPRHVLHDMIMIDRCPPLMIHFALRKNPTLIHEKDGNGNLPIHTAAHKRIARSQKSTANHIQIIRQLLEFHPDACREFNNDGKFPLQVAAESGKTFENGLHEIFLACPEAIVALLETLPQSVTPHILAKLGSLSGSGAGADANLGIGCFYRIFSAFPNIIPRFA